MRKRITIEVEVSGHEEYTEQQINDFLESEFVGTDLSECEDVFLDDVFVGYNVTMCKIEGCE